MKKCLRTVSLCLALVLAMQILPALWRKAEKLRYPRRYEPLVLEWAETYGLDPLLVFSFIRTESGFDAAATSSVQARGLMQMTEETFVWLSGKVAADEELTFDDLFNPAVSIRFGCYYIHLCMERYQGDLATTAAAYHSGWGTVDALLQQPQHSRDGKTLNNFPYNQMNHYVKKITACYEVYTRLYGSVEPTWTKPTGDRRI